MSKWISAHIFYDNTNQLLKNAVYPLVEDLKKKKKVKQFFFIRYWERGPHVRLRLLVDDAMHDEVQSLTSSHLRTYMNEFPSSRAVNESGFYPDNTVQYIPYEPEVNRYGGVFGIKAAEKHFQHSSEAVLDLILNYEVWDLAIAQGKAIELYITFFKAVDVPPEYIQNMLYAMNNSHWKDIAQSIVGKENDIVDVFKANFKKNEAAILNYAQRLDEIVPLHLDDFAYLSDFYNGVKDIDEELNSAFINGNLALEHKGPANLYVVKSIIYISYLHMLNNRLGLKNHDEGYLSFVMSKIHRHLYSK